MASTSAGPPSTEVAQLCRVAQTPGISKAQLQTICVVNGLAKTGNKSDLQRRIVTLIRDCEQRRDLQRFQEVRHSIYNNAGMLMAAQRPQLAGLNTHPPHYSPTTAAGQPAYPNMTLNNGYAPNGYGVASPPRPAIVQSFQYKHSPFYEMKARIGEVRVCDVMSQHRQTVNFYVRAQDHPALQQVLADPTSMRVMVFCAADNHGTQDISFPYQSELKVNGGEVKANLRGLKNKPGSTRPADITNLLRLKPSTYNNNVEFTYALTHKKYYLGVYACKVAPIDELVEQIKTSKRIAKASVMQEITKKANDPDVVATSQNISLKDPLCYSRLVVPCRGLKCSHIQCFDAKAYLQLQEQGPQWLCPICNNPAPFEHLAVDEYVKDILTNTASTVEQVTIEPDGKWFAPSPEANNNNGLRHETSFVEDDDVIIAHSTSTPNRSGYAFSTPIQGSSREGSSMPRSTTSSKRPAAEVIDLTLSDDDSADTRPAKRQNTQHNGYPGWSH